MSDQHNTELEKLWATVHHLERLIAEAQHVLEATALILYGVKAELCHYPMLTPPDLSEGPHDENRNAPPQRSATVPG